MTQSHPFYDLHRHGFVRVATSTPKVRTADVAYNRDGIIAEARRAHEAGVDLVVYPELCLSSYAIDDLHLQQAMIEAVEEAIGDVVEASRGHSPVLLIGAALADRGRLFNCGLAIADGKLLGVVPKSYLPNYREFYEKRWFTSGIGVTGRTIRVAGQEVPFGTDLVFASNLQRDFIFHIEICEDFWAPAPPSSLGALAGATILCNLSASNIVIGKADDRHLLCSSQSARTYSAYVYSAGGHGESTTDLAWDGQGVIYELGGLLAESERFSLEPELCIADVDCTRIVNDRLRLPTYADAARAAGNPEQAFRTVFFDHRPASGDLGLQRPMRRFPFVPDRADKLDADCYEAFNIQVDGLMRRVESAKAKSLIIGVSGGLDSTHALIVMAKTCDRLGMPRSAIRGYTMPGFGTSEGTKSNAWKLMDALGITAEEIDIRPAATTMLKDIGHPFGRGEKVYDVTFENVQAGLRTDYLFRLASQHSGFVVGTGDLSELALGWCTYGVGDHMSHYAVNAGVPKTLMQYLIRWTATTQVDDSTRDVLLSILGTEISPELVPAGEDGEMQSTEDKIGPYALNDFFLHHVMRFGQKPSKVAFLAWHAWHDAARGEWPAGLPEDVRATYDLPVIAKWLEEFLKRFFAFAQYKRSAIPNGPKVSSGGALSPRGDWRAPSDASAEVWLEELRRGLPSSG
ncbi:NAD+ synthase (glutamine-hydrolyzing) [Novosphingobium chloroacetimidivorans]|uniref:Glutamine-dependent NAD(+) synthetase n=1 Tax=Novosphingobium chloroacetimidivorans TaxID=1428314 RepID=A0A7W7NWK6_9SPHN|nr:NAD(+) synthase [Novosphingobium chloroacetimidivorans]MBB4858202.1 NAD+ synthase (glutamine-hydrolyzing) [Novosphingobium chloroacetimidivorans]